jgi:hypothetical protein
MLSLGLAAWAAPGMALAQDGAGWPVDISLSPDNFLRDFSVVSRSATETRLQLTGIDSWRERSYEYWENVHTDFIYAFDVEVQPGYQVTGFSFDVTGSALVMPDPLATTPGHGSVDTFAAWISADYTDSSDDSITGLGTSPHTLSVVMSDRSLTGNFSLIAATSWWMTLAGGYSYNFEGMRWYRPTYIDVTQSDAFLVIHTAPVAAVPEPAGGVMLLLGVGICFAVCRRSQEKKAWPPFQDSPPNC